MKDYDKILKILNDQFGWNLTNSLTNHGKKLVSDTLKANELLLKEKTEQKQGFFKRLNWKYYIIAGAIIGILLAELHLKLK